MQTIEYRDVIDKSGWGEGPWNDEPDKLQWQDEKTGLPCLIVRNRKMGNWCGYVGVPDGHPFYDMPDDEAQNMVEVHGGLTFSSFCQETDSEREGVCHVPGEGEPDNVWWLGFDCAHSGDNEHNGYYGGIMPTLKAIGPEVN